MIYDVEQTPQPEQSGKPYAPCEGEGGGGEGGGGEGGGGGEATAQIVKPVLVTELSLDQVTFVPAATCTFVGPVEPEYLAFPIVTKS